MADSLGTIVKLQVSSAWSLIDAALTATGHVRPRYVTREPYARGMIRQSGCDCSVCYPLYRVLALLEDAEDEAPLLDDENFTEERRNDARP